MATTETYPEREAQLDAKEPGINPEALWQAADKAQLADGGAYPAVRPELVPASEIVAAPEGGFAAFSDATGELIDRAEANKREIRLLAAMRDALLPKLILSSANAAVVLSALP